MGSHRIRYPAGSVAYLYDQADYAVVIDRGLIRIYVATIDGRQATIHYIHPAELMSWGLVFSPSIKVHVQAVMNTEVTNLDATLLRRMARDDAHVAGALWTYMVGLEANSTRIIAIRSLGNITERLAFDLLDRACVKQLASGRLEVNATQQQLADSIGSVREVVARALRKLSDEGVVETARTVIRVLDIERLEDVLTRALI
jgi:CRP/FNR family transcriptional regulator